MSNQTGGALPFPMPPSDTGISPPSLRGKSDKQVAKVTAAHITKVIGTTNDPQLKAELAKIVADLHNHLAQDTRADRKGQAPKVSSKAVSEPKPKKK